MTMDVATYWTLIFEGYDLRVNGGSDAYNLRHAGAIFADSWRWLWR